MRLSGRRHPVFHSSIEILSKIVDSGCDGDFLQPADLEADSVMRQYFLAMMTVMLGLAVLAMPAWAQSAEPVAETEQAQTFTDLINETKASMMRDPVEAMAAADRAEAFLDAGGASENAVTEYATVGWLQSEATTRLGRPLEGRPYAERALERLGPNPEPTKLYADLLVSLGRIDKLTGEHSVALANFQAAYEVFREIGHTRSEAIVLQSIASIYTGAHQYERAIEYYSNANARHQGDLSLELSAENNIGNAYRAMGEYGQALGHFERARELAAEMESPVLEARILTNLGSMHVAFGEFDAADAVIDAAFALLPDRSQTEWTRFLWGVRAQSAHGRGDHREAEVYIDRTFADVVIAETNQHFIEFHEVAASIFIARGAWESAVPHLQAFKRLDDEGREVAASANSALLGAEFDFAEQELEIEQLRTEGLEQELALAGSIARQRLVLGSGITLVLLVLSLGLFWRTRAANERRKVVERALYEDVDTGLPSRKAVQREIENIARQLDRPATLVVLGIERYKHLAGVLGFAKSAELHKTMVARLKQNFSADMVGMVSPGVLGLILTSHDMAAASEEAERLRKVFLTPVDLDDLQIDIAITAGLAAGTDGETCVKQALIGLEQARELGHTSATFSARRFGDPAQNLSLMSRMLAATRNGQMAMHYQPKLHLKSGTYGAAEALCRWHDAERGFIAPDEFIPLAEETGHIREFTEWSIRQVVQDQQAMHRAGHDINLAVNISGALISDPEFAELALLLVETAPGQLIFEITETAAMQNPERAMANLERWAKAGIKLSIDDYGSGLSSLAYLKTLPSHELKLDRAFVEHVATSDIDRMLVKSTADLAHGLGLEMTAEGIECEEGLALLKLYGCDWAQGYILSKARPLDSLIEFLGENQAVSSAETPDRQAGLG
jgi:EAL domain-containing protein (putative c-di-GMP-specific phosphodiesterase class I)/tetratricopeptide (TPR) repeat protein